MDLTKEELQALIGSVKTLTEQNAKILSENAELKILMSGDGGARVLKRVTQRQVEVRMVDKKVVIGYVNHGTDKSPVFWYKKPNPRDAKEMLDMVDLVLEGAKEALPIEVAQFRKESQRVKCNIVKTEEKEHVINQGVVKKREVEEYSSIELDFDVPVDVISKTYLFTVNVPSEYGGPREVKVGESMVNIA